MNKKQYNTIDDNNCIGEHSEKTTNDTTGFDVNKTICGEKRFSDIVSQEKIEKANKIIQENAHFICEAANSFGLSPVDVAMVIYAEQCFYTELKDETTDPIITPSSDISLGLGRMRISIAKTIEDSGYMPVTHFADWRGNKYVENREYGIALKLLDLQTNVKYVAAYLSLIIDSWKNKYPSIQSNHLVLATLYNNGVNKIVGDECEDNPKNKLFGKFASQIRQNLNQLLG